MKELAAAILQFLQFQAKAQQELAAAINRLSDLVAADRETEAVRGPDGRVVGARSRIKQNGMMQ